MDGSGERTVEESTEGFHIVAGGGHVRCRGEGSGKF